jgi:hypothetical protein
MKRDFELIRLILRDIESAPPLIRLKDFKYDGYDAPVITEHIELLIEARLVKGEVTRFIGGGGMPIVMRLTWEGHEFLNGIEDDRMTGLTLLDHLR